MKWTSDGVETMSKTELLDKTARDGEERILLARTLDKLELTRRRNIPACTPFLSPGERTSVEALINASGRPEHLFFGGYEGAERTVCVFLPDWQESGDWLDGEEIPVSALHAAFPADAGLTHRDFLGAILGLGLDREKVGDILVGESGCDFVILKEIEEFLLLHMESAGRTRLKLSPIALSALTAPEVQVKLIRDTVATLRLDAVAATAFSLPRAKAADLISAGRVLLNHRECAKPDRSVGEGDVLSCRGMGKCVVKKAGGLSKKGRIMIELERYL